MKYIWHLFFHFFSSNSRHGTHSPFVYKIANEVVYVRSKNADKAVSKPQALLCDLAAYFDVAYVHSGSVRGRDRSWVVEDDVVDVEQLAKLCPYFKYLVIPNIYADKARKQLWHVIVQDTRFIVCIDLFYYGLIFNRSEQPKELFKLRFPYWR